ncbi:MFS transporter [Paenibacillus alvei]|uniref:MFS transporter n=1 Tax=Paenibacillus alvei TaxID=44250 RepID=UPI0013DB5016|nr:MFS transporter [Paenibacillus alvei]NEZ41227.1 MFS transporter [Paenibacillus alvei]
MLRAYRELFTAPGSFIFSSAGFIARMPISMTGIGLVTMIAQMRGEYGLAGAIAATFALASALLAPQVSRLVDRMGQSRVLRPAAALSIISILALLLCARLGAPDWTLFLFAVMAGCMPSMPAMVRARWTELYRGSPKLHTAYSFESVVDEICFIIGPVISVGLCVSVFPEAGPLAACLFMAFGIVVFTLHKGSEPAVHPQHNASQGSVFQIGALRLLALTLAAIGTIFGTVDVVSVAFAEQQGNTLAASYVLSVYAIGSCLAGLIFGTLKINMPLFRQFAIAVSLSMVTLLPLFIVNNLTTLAITVFFSGMSVAPTMIITMGLVEKIVPGHQLTEGMTWATTGLGIGVALGSAIAGWVVDHFGVHMGFMVAIAAGVLALGIMAGGYKALCSAYNLAAVRYDRDSGYPLDLQSNRTSDYC